LSCKREFSILLSPYEPSRKICYKSVHNLFSYHGHRQTDTQTDTQAPAKHTPRFRDSRFSRSGDMIADIERK